MKYNINYSYKCMFATDSVTIVFLNNINILLIY